MQTFHCTILVIEPTRLYREILETHINELGLCAVYVKDAQQAKTKLEAEGMFELVLCASQLPDANGIELCEYIRLNIAQTTPILLLSSIIDKLLIRSALHGGITEVIQRDRLIEIQPYLQKIANFNVEPKNKKPHVLVVEDSESIAQMTMFFLKKHDCFVDVTQTAEAAVTLLSKHNYDIVITDILLEGNMTGINLIRHIRSLAPPRNNLPILAISGLNKDSGGIESLRLSATDFIIKPINYEELIVRMENLIRTKRLFDRVYEQGLQLQKLAMTDPLTNLYNRHYLSAIMPNRLQESDRHNQPLSIILVDLDKFKSINESYGHLHGDQVLVDISKVLLKNCAGEDFAVRFGGDEFILILSHCDIKDAEQKAHLIKQQIEAMHYKKHGITASIGVASKPEFSENLSFNQLFDMADRAVYKAKHQGGNYVVSSNNW
ncbi:MAG: diguanylate cyclase [Saccharospirillaceae bacterium]|nr:diguanylate cyclase [Pseudomonadales bacterium]NRB79586.1 diguanylate cyclase [Saccharospirillaceae bacterium]